MRYQPTIALLMFITMNAIAQDAAFTATNPKATFHKELIAIPEGSCTEPKYTETPRSLEEIGVVRLQFDISAEGKTTGVRSLTENEMLSPLSLRYLSGCVFPPTRLAGKSVPSQIIVPVEWKLNGVSNPIVQIDETCRPRYPISARRVQAKGTTKLIVRVSETNEIVDVSVSSSSGNFALDQEATKAIKQCKALAGTSGGKPKEKNTTVIIHWEIAD